MRTVLSIVAMVAVAAFSGGVVVGWQTDPDGVRETVSPVTEDSPTASPEPVRPGRAERLLAEYGCWTGEAQGRVPTHAVVSLPGERAELVDADTGYAIWLDEAPGRLYGFCP